jgi:hypothetical protein
MVSGDLGWVSPQSWLFVEFDINAKFFFKLLVTHSMTMLMAATTGPAMMPTTTTPTTTSGDAGGKESMGSSCYSICCISEANRYSIDE